MDSRDWKLISFEGDDFLEALVKYLEIDEGKMFENYNLDIFKKAQMKIKSFLISIRHHSKEEIRELVNDLKFIEWLIKDKWAVFMLELNGGVELQKLRGISLALRVSIHFVLTRVRNEGNMIILNENNLLYFLKLFLGVD